MVQIRPAVAADLDAVWALVCRAVRHANALGNPQWGEDYPTRAHYAADIARGELYVACALHGQVLGAACINADEDPAYAAVDWQFPAPALVLHRMAVDPTAQRQGVGRAFFAYAEALARAREIHALRVDTYGKNDRMQALLCALGFRRAGEIHLHGRPLYYPCFEKNT